MELAVEGGTNDWGEVVTRQPYRKVRLDHLLSKDIFGTSSLEDDKRNNIDILYSVLNAHLEDSKIVH